MRRMNPEFEEQWFSEWLANSCAFGAATDLLNRAIVEDPERAWELIGRLIDSADGEVPLQCVAAGPLEDLLCEHGPQFIVRVESAARERPQFKLALATVWGYNRMVAEVRERVSVAARNGPAGK